MFNKKKFLIIGAAAVLLIAGLALAYYGLEIFDKDKIVSLFDEWKACAQDADCAETQANCCNCGHGGIQTGINKQYLEKWQDILKKKCQDVGCIALFNCKEGKAVCDNNKCEFKEDVESASPNSTEENMNLDKNTEKVPISENCSSYPDKNLENIEESLFYYDILKDKLVKAYIYNFFVANLDDFSTKKIYSNKTYVKIGSPDLEKYAEKVFERFPFPQNDHYKRIKRYGKDKIITNLFNEKEFEFDVIDMYGNKEVKNYPIADLQRTIFSDDISLIVSPMEYGINGVKILDSNGQILKNIEINFFKPLPDMISPWFFSDNKFIYGISWAETGTAKCFSALWKIDIKSANVIKGLGVGSCVGSSFNYSHGGIIMLEHNTKDMGEMFPEAVAPSQVSMINLESFTKKELFTNEELLVYDALLSSNGQEVLYVTEKGLSIFNINTSRHENISDFMGIGTILELANDKKILYKKFLYHTDIGDSFYEYHLVDIKTREDKILPFFKPESFLVSD